MHVCVSMSTSGIETVPLLPSNSATVEYGGIEPKVHSGYGASRLPLKPTSAGGAAGSQYDKIFQHQLGRAASTGNPLNLFTSRDEYYNSVPWSLRRLPLTERNRLIKPFGVEWNRESKGQYPEHWKLVNPRAGLKRVQQQKEKAINKGLVLPFSNNIGPGNTIQDSRTGSDTIAQGHDLHYSEAKTDSDIKAADSEAIGQFIAEATRGNNPISQTQAVIGAVGLAGKQLVEHLTGKVQYGKYAC